MKERKHRLHPQRNVTINHISNGSPQYKNIGGSITFSAPDFLWPFKKFYNKKFLVNKHFCNVQHRCVTPLYRIPIWNFSCVMCKKSALNFYQYILPVGANYNFLRPTKQFFLKELSQSALQKTIGSWEALPHIPKYKSATPLKLNQETVARTTKIKIHEL